MKMYDKNGKLSPVGQAIFNSGMERLRTGEDAFSIAKDLASQVKLVKYEGHLIHDGKLTEQAVSLTVEGITQYWLQRFSVFKGIKRENIVIDFEPPTVKPKPFSMGIENFWLFPRKSKTIIGDVNTA